MRKVRSGLQYQAGIGKFAVFLLILISMTLGAYLFSDSEPASEPKKELADYPDDIVGNVDDIDAAAAEIAAGFSNTPVELRELADNVYQVTGVSNAHVIKTPEGSVVFDTGVSSQAAEQYELLKEVTADSPVKYVVYSHSHTDSIGGHQFWAADATVIASQELEEEQRYQRELQPYFYQRSKKALGEQTEYSEDLSFNSDTAVGLSDAIIVPDIKIASHRDHAFELGGVKFEVLYTPGAEGIDGVSLWLPEQKILFAGDLSGAIWPQFPAIFSMRGAKPRKSIEYITALEKVMALEPEMVVTAHFNPVTGKDNIQASLIKMRDAVEFVHGATARGMMSGRPVEQLMREIVLSDELDLPQVQGRVSWAVKTIWEYYSTWFHFDTTTELYPVPATDMYAEFATTAGVEGVLAKAQQRIDAKEWVHAVHLLDMALSAEPSNADALNTYIAVHESLLQQADEHNNIYEKNYLQFAIDKARATLSGLSNDLGEES